MVGWMDGGVVGSGRRWVLDGEMRERAMHFAML